MSYDRKSRQVAIAHEWVSARAGSEKVFEALAQQYTSADLYALSATPGVDLDTGGRIVRTTFLDGLGPLRDRRSLTLPLMPLAWSVAGFRQQYDVVISSSHACVKGFRPGRSARHFCYVHAPMRYVWSPQIDRRGAARALSPARHVLKRWDLRSVGWVDSFAANSLEVAARIEHYYDRAAVVIPPPVDTRFFRNAVQPETKKGLVAVGRLIRYKGFDKSIAVAAALGEPLTIVGRGPDEARLRSLAKASQAHVTVVTDASDEQVRAYMAGAATLLFPAVEDFGIIPVEAQAAGTPVVGPRAGGLRDTVRENVTGVLAESNEVDDLVDATRRCLERTWDATELSEHADTFSGAAFASRVRAWVGF